VNSEFWFHCGKLASAVNNNNNNNNNNNIIDHVILSTGEKYTKMITIPGDFGTGGCVGYL